jgi:type II secretory pathway component GspD/PulD (secretin)
MRLTSRVFIVTVAVAFCGQQAWAQSAPAAAAPASTTTAASTVMQTQQKQNEGMDSYRGRETVEKTFYFNYATGQSDLTDIVTAVRNVISPAARIYLVVSQKAMVVRVIPEDLVTIQKMLDELDRPRKTYQVTYTINEMDGGKRIGTQHFAMVLTAGQRTQLKQGSKVPVVTGTSKKDGGTMENAVSYLDIGMNFDATLEESANGVSLRSKVEQLSLAEEKSGVGVQDPVIRQTVLEGTSFLAPGKPLVLGSVDIPGSTRHLDVEVVMEQVK